MVIKRTCSCCFVCEFDRHFQQKTQVCGQLGPEKTSVRFSFVTSLLSCGSVWLLPSCVSEQRWTRWTGRWRSRRSTRRNTAVRKQRRRSWRIRERPPRMTNANVTPKPSQSSLRSGWPKPSTGQWHTFYHHGVHEERVSNLGLLQGPGHKDQKTSHPFGGPDASGAAACRHCGCRTSKSWKEHLDPLPDQELHKTEAGGHLWTGDHCLWWIGSHGLEQIRTSEHVQSD